MSRLLRNAKIAGNESKPINVLTVENHLVMKNDISTAEIDVITKTMPEEPKTIVSDFNFKTVMSKMMSKQMKMIIKH